MNSGSGGEFSFAHEMDAVQPDEPMVADTAPHPPQSRVGIACAVVAAVAWLLLMIACVMFALTEMKQFSSLEVSIPDEACGAAVIATVALAVFGCGLGVGAVAQRERSRAYAFVGLAGNGALVLIFSVMLVLGLLLGD